MPRLMSVALTEQAVRDRRKTVTRRLGWATLQPGTELDLCRKVMGRRKGDPLIRIARVRVTEVRRQPLRWVTDEEVAREGFRALDLQQWSRVRDHSDRRCLCGLGRDATSRYCAIHWECAPFAMKDAFVAFFTHHMRVTPDTEVNRIGWEYLPIPDDWPAL
jgi:hypothetical protein